MWNHPYRQKSPAVADAQTVHRDMFAFHQANNNKRVQQREMTNQIEKWVTQLRSDYPQIANRLRKLLDRVPIMNRSDEQRGFWGDFREIIDDLQSAFPKPKPAVDLIQQRREAQRQAQQRETSMRGVTRATQQIGQLIQEALATIADARQLEKSDPKAFRDKYNKTADDPYKQLCDTLRRETQPILTEITPLHTSQPYLTSETKGHAAKIQNNIADLLTLLDAVWQSRSYDTNLKKIEGYLRVSYKLIQEIIKQNAIKSSLKAQFVYQMLKLGETL